MLFIGNKETLGTINEIPNFRGWVEKLLTVAPMEGRSWKSLSHRFGWKVKTHGRYDGSSFNLWVITSGGIPVISEWDQAKQSTFKKAILLRNFYQITEMTFMRN
ncbi:uncharacterized protein LOC107782190 isoform X2 [Nicotiana tabacum]|uniref:Uncharacterized protein LOC107782190 isoform X2 n=3 Tax=Nicotiana tabacum TaxID=4097 RepID=A0AC58UVI9_TOBAC|nr:PREDICTED: uncharacterized protein LOC107782190 [Nicotiana tabacum]